jgi:glutathione S-transferase
MNEPLTLHQMPSSGNCFKVELALTQLGRSYRTIDVDITRGQSRTPEFLALNPNGRVPLLVLPDGRTLAESNAILCWLARGTPLLPDDPWLQAKVLEWLFFEQYSHEPYIATLRYWIHILGDAEGHGAEIEARRPRGYAALGVLEQRLEDHAWLVDSGYSVADIALYAYTHVADEADFDLTPYPAVRAWLERVAATPDFRPMRRA